MFAIRCIARAGRISTVAYKDSPAGLFLKEYDPEACNGRGRVTWTNDPFQIHLFATFREAASLWKAVPANRPVRDDGRPNRPLTAYTVEIIEYNLQ